MMVQKEDLGLSLSLNFPEKTRAFSSHHSSLQLNHIMPSPSSFSLINKASWPEAFSETRSLLKGIDVNCLPTTEEEGGISSPNSTVSSVSRKRSEREATGGSEDHDADRACSRGISDEEDAENARKKLRLSKDQSAILEESFKEHNTFNPKQKIALAKRLGLRPRQVEVWFQNRRARLFLISFIKALPQSVLHLLLHLLFLICHEVCAIM